MAVISNLPQKTIFSLGKILGHIFYVVDKRHRRIVRRNLQFSGIVNEKNPLSSLTRKVYYNAAVSFLEILQLSRMTREQVLQRVEIKGAQYLLAAKDSSKGAIVISAHFGNWEMAHVFGSCFLGEPLVLVARRISPLFLDTWLNKVRSKFGSTVLDKGSALPKMIRALRQGKILGLLVDQGTLFSDGVEVTFFGKKTNATPAAAILARRYDVPVIPVFCPRKENGMLEIRAFPPLKLQKTEDYQNDIQANTQKMTHVIERMIRDYPDQWFWFHKRWKRHHPYLYPEDMARRKRKKIKKKKKLLANTRN